MSRRTLAPALTLVACLAPGCKEDSVSKEDAADAAAEQVCQSLFSCMCMPPPYATEEACRTAVAADVQAAIDEGTAAGFSYDGECAADNIEAIDDLGCDSAYDLYADGRLDDDGRTCKAFYGEGQLLDPCTSLTLSNGDSCAKDLACNQAEVCSDPDAQPGDLEAGEPCQPNNDYCGDGLVCADPEGDGQPVCVLEPGVGDTCIPDRLGCGEEAYCDPTTEQCVAVPDPGEPCAPQNAGLLRCGLTGYCGADDVCVALPTVDEPCLMPGLSLLLCEYTLECVGGLCAEPQSLICLEYAP